jgi:hypothetical protein
MANARYRFRAALIASVQAARRARGSDDYLIVAAVLGPLVPVGLLALAASGAGVAAEAAAFAVLLISTAVMMTSAHLSKGSQ